MATGYIRSRERYSDFKVNFTEHPVKKDLVRVLNEDAVKRSLMNLMLTSPYERFFYPEKGAGLTDYLFENFDAGLEEALEEKIIQVAGAYEPRAEIIAVDVKTDQERHYLFISITFVTINTTEPQTFDFTLERIR